MLQKNKRPITTSAPTTARRTAPNVQTTSVSLKRINAYPRHRPTHPRCNRISSYGFGLFVFCFSSSDLSTYAHIYVSHMLDSRAIVRSDARMSGHPS